MKPRLLLLLLVVAACAVASAIAYAVLREPVRPAPALSQACRDAGEACTAQPNNYRPAPARRTPNSSADYQQGKKQ